MTYEEWKKEFTLIRDEIINKYSEIPRHFGELVKIIDKEGLEEEDIQIFIAIKLEKINKHVETMFDNL